MWMGIVSRLLHHIALLVPLLVLPIPLAQGSLAPQNVHPEGHPAASTVDLPPPPNPPPKVVAPFPPSMDGENQPEFTPQVPPTPPNVFPQYPPSMDEKNQPEFASSVPPTPPDFPPLFPPNMDDEDQRKTTPLPPHFPGVPDDFSPFLPQETAGHGAENFWRQAAVAFFDYCHQACNSTGMVQSSFKDHNCESCFCDDACFLYGDCCPDKYAAFGYRNLTDQEFHCSRTYFGTSFTFDYVMVTQCPEPAAAASNNSSYEALRAECETSATSHWNLTQPVTDARSFVTYKNRYCALCHSNPDATERLVPWEPRVVITNYSYVMGMTSSTQLYSAVLADPVNVVSYVNPASVKPHVRKCFDDRVVSRCNETGVWTHYDVNVETACQRIFAPVETFMGTTYRNPFCLLCNTWRTWTQVLDDDPGVAVSGPEDVSLLILLDFGDDDDDDDRNEGLMRNDLEAQLNCSEEQIVDVNTMSCRDIVCGEGKLTKRREDAIACQSYPKSSNIYGYKICFLDSKNARDVENDAEIADTKLLSYNNENLVYASGDVYMFAAPRNSTVGNTNLYVFNMFLHIPMDRDAVDEAMLSNLTTFLDLFSSELESASLRLAPTCSKSVLKNLLGTNIREPFRVQFETRFHNRQYVPEGTIYLPLFKNVTCPSVELDPGEFDYDHDTDEIIVRQSNKSSTFIRVGIPNFALTESNTALICYSDYKKVSFSGNTSGNFRSKKTPSYWVARFFIIVSLVFLFISFVIYCLFSSLRTIAGINNLILIVALFTAQLLLQIGDDVPLPDWLCQVIGVTTHFSWLAVVFAQNVCTFHMFYTLSFPLLSHATLANPALLTKKYTAYVLLTSAAFVAATLSWQLGAEGRSGYGGSSACFITKGLVKIIMFAAPLAGTVALNVAMFVFTIVRLSTMQRVQSTRSNRTNLLLYTKLSVFTGLTWLFGFLYSLVESPVLAYLFAVFQGCQGLLIFLAFLANKRVLGMLRERVGLWRKRQKRYTDSSLSTKTQNLTAAANTPTTDKKLSGKAHASQDQSRSYDTEAVSSEAFFINSVL